MFWKLFPSCCFWHLVDVLPTAVVHCDEPFQVFQDHGASVTQIGRMLLEVFWMPRGVVLCGVQWSIFPREGTGNEQQHPGTEAPNYLGVFVDLSKRESVT